MFTSSKLHLFKNYLQSIDWLLLFFLIGVLDVKLVVKLAVIVFIFFLQGYGLSQKNKIQTNFIQFYFLMIAIAVADWFLNKGFVHLNYSIATLTGIGFWVLCILSSYLILNFTSQNNVEVLYRTISLFFILNCIFSLLNYFSIVWEIKDFNPYRYQGQFQKYFISTGDYIRGISFDTSTTNAVINAFGVLFFLKGKKYLETLLCMIALLLATSNIVNLLLIFCLLLIFFFYSTTDQKSIILICFTFFVVFSAKVSPQNEDYTLNGIKNILFDKKKDSLQHFLITQVKMDSNFSQKIQMDKIAHRYIDSLSEIEVKQSNSKSQGIVSSEKPFIPQPSIHSAPFQRKRDTSTFQKELIAFAHLNNIPIFQIITMPGKRTKPGKWLAYKTTYNYFKQNPLKIINGCGAGNFSSKLAFKSTALNIGGGYPVRYRYINDDFKNNHLAVFLSYYVADKERHSVVNTPNSVYLQLFSEYGILGLVGFLFLYFIPIAKQYRQLTYGLPLILFTVVILFTDYWFEQLSIIILFELLILIDLKKNNPKESYE